MPNIGEIAWPTAKELSNSVCGGEGEKGVTYTAVVRNLHYSDSMALFGDVTLQKTVEEVRQKKVRRGLLAWLNRQPPRFEPRTNTTTVWKVHNDSALYFLDRHDKDDFGSKIPDTIKGKAAEKNILISVGFINSLFAPILARIRSFHNQVRTF